MLGVLGVEEELFKSKEIDWKFEGFLIEFWQTLATTFPSGLF